MILKTVEDLKAAHRELESQIAKLLRTFSDDFKISVTCIAADYSDRNDLQSVHVYYKV